MQSTISEDLFVNLCDSLGLVTAKIPESHTKTPDFVVTSALGEFYAEIKELRPNEEERRLLEQFRDTRWVTVAAKLGHRASGMIEEAKYQLRAFKHHGLPGLIVLYDNITLNDGTNLGPRGPLSPDHITAAMFGKWVVDFLFNKATGELVDRKHRCGPNENFNEDMKTYVSGVMVLSNYFGPLKAAIYHNPYATSPLPVTIFKGDNCFNMRVPIERAKCPQSWVRCD
jgi:hypothetical protein